MDNEEKIARLKALLSEVATAGLIYWEPQTARGRMAKADMLRRIQEAIK